MLCFAFLVIAVIGSCGSRSLLVDCRGCWFLLLHFSSRSRSFLVVVVPIQRRQRLETTRNTNDDVDDNDNDKKTAMLCSIIIAVVVVIIVRWHNCHHCPLLLIMTLLIQLEYIVVIIVIVTMTTKLQGFKEMCFERRGRGQQSTWAMASSDAINGRCRGCLMVVAFLWLWSWLLWLHFHFPRLCHRFSWLLQFHETKMTRIIMVAIIMMTRQRRQW